MTHIPPPSDVFMSHSDVGTGPSLEPNKGNGFA